MATEFPIGANTDPAVKDIDKLIAALRKAGKEAGMTEKEIEDITDSTKKMGTDGVKNVSNLNQSFGGLNNIAKRVQNTFIAVFAAERLLAFSQHLIKITSDFQKYEALLKNTFGSRSAAFQAFVNIQAQAAKTNFSLNEVTQGYLKLANNGIKPSNAELTAFFDLTNNAGKGFDMFVEAVNDATRGEFERLKEFFISAHKEGDKVTFTFKNQTFEVDNNAESIKNLLVQLGQLNGVSGATTAIVGTMEGKISNFSDNLNVLVKSLGDRSSGLIGGFLDLANNALDSLNKSLNDNVVALQKEQLQLNVLVGAVTDTNISEEARKKLIEEMNREYPDFLRNLDVEKVTNEQLRDRLKDVNQQFVRKITLAAAEKRFTETQEEILDLIDKEVEARKEIQEIREGAIKFQDTAESGMRQGMDADQKARTRIADLEHSIYNIQQQRVELQKEVTDRLLEYDSALNIFNETNNDYFNTEDKATKKTEERAKAAFNLKEALKKINDELRRLKEEEEKLGAIGQKLFFEPLQKSADDALKAGEAAMEKYSEKYNEVQDEIARRDDERMANREDGIRQLNELSIQAGNILLENNQLNIERDIEALEYRRDRELELAGDNEAAKEQIRKKYAAREAQLRAKQAESERQQAIFNLAVNQGPAVARAFRDFPFYVALPIAALVALQFVDALTKTKSAPVPKFATGVFDLDGPGTATSDSIDARLSRGESVADAETTNKFGDILKPMIENEFFSYADIKRIVDQKIPSQVTALVIPSTSGNENPRLLEEIRDGIKDLKNKRETHLDIDEDGFLLWTKKGHSRTNYVNKRYKF